MRLVLAALLALWPGWAAAEGCRQALALGLDVSGSVDAREHRLQRAGLATALASEAVQARLFAGGQPPVWIAVFEWAGPEDQTVIVDWTPLRDASDLARVAGRLQSAPRATRSLTTAIGAAMLTGFDLLGARAECWSRTLDLSGDGEANTGPRPHDVDLPADGTDIVVNGLVIGQADRAGGDDRAANIRELSTYYAGAVIRGPEAFVETALGFEDYAAAMERKLLKELRALAVAAR